jgi:hypothetical protein
LVGKSSFHTNIVYQTISLAMNYSSTSRLYLRLKSSWKDTDQKISLIHS